MIFYVASFPVQSRKNVNAITPQRVKLIFQCCRLVHTKIATFDIDDIFTIDNPEFEKYIPDIYPAELHFNKANTSDKETSFLDLHIKVIRSDMHTSVYDKRDAFGFPINFPMFEW